MEIFFSPVFDVDNQLQKVKCAQSIGVNNFKYISFSQSVPNLRTSLLKLHSLVMPDLSNAQMYTFCPGTPSRGWFPRLKNFSNLRVTPLTKVWMGYDGTNFRNNFFQLFFVSVFCLLTRLLSTSYWAWWSALTLTPAPDLVNISHFKFPQFPVDTLSFHWYGGSNGYSVRETIGCTDNDTTKQRCSSCLRAMQPWKQGDKYSRGKLKSKIQWFVSSFSLNLMNNEKNVPKKVMRGFDCCNN